MHKRQYYGNGLPDHQNFGNLMDIDQELKQIPIELRDLRLKRAALEKEIKDLFSKKLEELKELEIIGNDKKRKGELLKAASIDYEKALLELDEKRREGLKIEEEHRREGFRLQSFRDQLQAQKEEQEKTSLAQMETADFLKNKKAFWLQKDTELKAREERIITDEINLRDKYEKLNLEAERKFKEACLKSQESSEFYEQVTGLKTKQDVEAEEVRKQANLNEEETKKLDLKRKSLEKLDLELSKKAIELKDREDRFNRKQEALAVDFINLETRTKDLRVRELRFEKLLKDKGLKDELEALEKSIHEK